VSALRTQYQGHIEQFVHGTMSVDDFSDWLDDVAWATGPDSPERGLIWGSHLRVTEFWDGAWTEEQLKGLLAPFAFTATDSRVRGTSQTEQLQFVLADAARRLSGSTSTIHAGLGRAYPPAPDRAGQTQPAMVRV